MNEKLYPADYTLEEWLRLRAGWIDRRGDELHWLRSQSSALGPSISALNDPAPGTPEREQMIQGIIERARIRDKALGAMFERLISELATWEPLSSP